MVTRLCNTFGIQTTLGEILAMPLRTFLMLRVSLIALTDRQVMEKDSQRAKQDLMKRESFV